MVVEAVKPEGRLTYADLRGYVERLEAAGLLRRIGAPVDLKHEIGAICERSLDRHGPGLLFENIVGYPGKPLVANIISTLEQVAIAFNTEPDPARIDEVLRAGRANPIPPRVVESGPCQEVVQRGDEIDVYAFPTPWWHEHDGGQYIGTTGGVVTADPDSGYLNFGMYRVMIKDRNTLTAQIKGPHPVGETPQDFAGRSGSHIHILKNEARGKPTPFALALGLDPLLTFTAAQAEPSDRIEHAEYAIAGGWRGAPVDLVKCQTNDLLVPAAAEIVIEGEVLLNERAPEGPHGESQGFYNANEQAFVIRVHCITHRRNPLSYGLICRSHEDYPKFLFSADVGEQLKRVDPRITAVHLPDSVGGGLGLMAIIAARVSRPEEVQEVAEAIRQAPAKGLRKQPRWLIVVDEDCDVTNWEDVMWRMTLGVMPHEHVRVRPPDQEILHEPLAHMYDYKGSSVVVDATFRTKRAVKHGRELTFPPVNRASRELLRKVESRWGEYGLD
jgi:4-hydroxy-3-polyprenylbenzoate decarboxylase